METEPWDFTAVYFDGIDHFSHAFMAYHPPKLPWIKDEDFALYKDVVKGAYRFHDMMLERLLELACGTGGPGLDAAPLVPPTARS